MCASKEETVQECVSLSSSRFTLSNATAISKPFMKRAPLVQSVNFNKDHYSPHMFINGSLISDHYTLRKVFPMLLLICLNIASSSKRKSELVTGYDHLSSEMPKSCLLNMFLSNSSQSNQASRLFAWISCRQMRSVKNVPV